MAYELTVDGYTFENPPESYRKLIRLNNNPQRIYKRDAPKFYHPDNQDIQLQIEGTLALNPSLGEPTDDQAELDRLRTLAIDGGEVQVQFDPFFSGKGVIKDDPFRQQDGESTYDFTISMNTETTDNSAYPAHGTPDTGNTFQIGDLNLGYDPTSVRQNYEQATESVERLQGISRTVDNKGLIPRMNLSGNLDGGGQAQLWQIGRSNSLKFLQSEFQGGYVLIDSLSIRNNTEAPHYLDGLFQYDLDLYLVKDSSRGIGEVATTINSTAETEGTYNSDELADGLFRMT